MQFHCDLTPILTDEQQTLSDSLSSHFWPDQGSPQSNGGGILLVRGIPLKGHCHGIFVKHKKLKDIF